MGISWPFELDSWGLSLDLSLSLSLSRTRSGVIKKEAERELSYQVCILDLYDYKMIRLFAMSVKRTCEYIYVDESII